jgi:hypothetical protein
MLRDGLCHGSDPLHPEYSDKPTNTNQWPAKMFVLGFALVLAPEQLWTPLPNAAMRNLAEWLSAVQHVGQQLALIPGAGRAWLATFGPVDRQGRARPEFGTHPSILAAG